MQKKTKLAIGGATLALLVGAGVTALTVPAMAAAPTHSATGTTAGDGDGETADDATTATQGADTETADDATASDGDGESASR
jgi:hypothetical protein